MSKIHNQQKTHKNKERVTKMDKIWKKTPLSLPHPQNRKPIFPVHMVHMKNSFISNEKSHCSIDTMKDRNNLK